MTRFVVMGVSGCGKTSVGQAVANGLGARFIDGDDLHPAASIAKMARGVALNDADRAPWLDLVGAALAGNENIVIGCSALKRAYRDRIIRAAGGPVTFLFLAGSRDVIAARLAARKGHFMPPALLESQFAALEPPGPDELAITANIDQPFGGLVDELLSRIGQRS